MIKVNENFCKGCHICVSVCPKKVLKPREQLNDRGVRPPRQATGDCIGCRMCELMCPDSAIRVEADDE